MRYLIDGYNLLFSSPFTKTLPEPSLEKSRDQLIDWFSQQTQALSGSFFLIFDAFQTDGLFERHHYNHLEIVYSSQGETADDHIVNLSEQFLEEKISFCVVSSDGLLCRKLKLLGVRVLSNQQFLTKLQKPYKKNPSEKKEDLFLSSNHNYQARLRKIFEKRIAEKEKKMYKEKNNPLF